jgi:Rrf2 family transcriptional regulator, cysteine metabolism repressor
MKLSTKGRYGVKAMVDLAIHYGGEPVSIKSISERQGISEYYLEQLFSPLRKSGLINSIRGAQGGYVLSAIPKAITVAEIMEVLEGPIEISSCLDEKSCNNVDCCATRLLWAKIKDSIDSVTKSTTLQDILDDYNNMNGCI